MTRDRRGTGIGLFAFAAIYVGVCVAAWHYSPSFRVGFSAFFGLRVIDTGPSVCR
jgi:hypothetical protein